ncbi:MAG: cyclic nucleotide-binding domain-containing protein [Polyangiales bacterium]
MSEAAPPRSPLVARLGADGVTRLAPHLVEENFAPGDLVVREGDAGRDLYLVFEGRARVVRKGLEVGTLGPGSHFGELALVTGAVRAATVVAASPLTVARLPPERFEGLVHDDPPLALALLRGVVDTLGAELTAVTDNLGALLGERTLPRRLTVRAATPDGERDVRTGTPVGDVLPARVGDALVVAALVDRKPVSLAAPLTTDAAVEPLTDAHWEGQRVARESAGLLLLEAAARVLPECDARLGPSLGVAQRVVFELQRPPPELLASMAAELDAEMRRLVALDAPFREELWALDEALDHLARAGWADAVALLRASREPTVTLVSCGQVYAPRHGPLLPRTGLVAGFAVAVEGDSIVLRHASEGPREPASEARGNGHGTRDAMAREHERWLGSLGVASAGEFNGACVTGRVGSIVRVAEGFHEKRLGHLADRLAERLADTRVVCVAGPSSSGKTTFLKRLSVQLQVMGINPVGLSLDDYYVDRVKTPRDAAGEYDFEALEAIDLGLLADHLGRALRGERVRSARYDFREGRSQPDGGPELSVGPRDVLILEGIHGLNPRLLEGTGAESSALRVFIMPMTSLPFDRLARLHPSDLRLLRRIVRDRHGRNHDAAATILRWPSVRAGERRHIFPFFERADVVFDTSLIYEPSVLKVYAERYLLEVPPTSPAFPTAFRLRRLIDRFVAIDAAHVPPTSILREFIGESSFVY